MIVLVLELFKGFVSDTSRIGKGNAHRSMVRPGRQDHPTDVPRSVSKSRRNEALGKLRREERGYHFECQVLSLQCLMNPGRVGGH